MLAGLVAGWQHPVLAGNDARLVLHESRAAGDLEILKSDGGPAIAIGYLNREELGRLPQVSAAVADDQDIPRVLHIQGVELDAVSRALHVGEWADMVDALCTDGYRSYYPKEMVATHRPILVTRIDGLSPRQWAAKNKQEDPGPYLILYRQFRPAWKVLAHEDKPQLPTNVVALEFEKQSAVFGRIAPRGAEAKRAEVSAGFRIAQQNCIRCHAEGATGGTKSSKTWDELGRDAHERPEWFAKVVRDPKSVNPNATMPGNPEYDAATLSALRSYFETFAEGR